MKREKVSTYKKGCRCKKCRGAIAAYSRKRRAANPEKVREYERRWYAANLEKARAKSRKWRAVPANRDYANRIYKPLYRRRKMDEEARSSYGL